MHYITNSSPHNDFMNFAINHMGVSSIDFHNWEKVQESLYTNPMTITPMGSLTPMILEERRLNVTQLSVFDRMAMERVLFISGVVNDRMSVTTIAQLEYLDSIGDADIKFYIDSPGGSVLSGLKIYDIMEYIKSDVSTINTGMAASMGSILLGGGTKGKRFSLKHARTMLHQVSSGSSGVIQNLRISLAETEKYNTTLFDLLGKFADKPAEEVLLDADRDLWLSSQETLDYGLIDGIIIKKGGEILRKVV